MDPQFSTPSCIGAPLPIFSPEIMSSWKPFSMTSLQSRMPKWNAKVSANHNRGRCHQAFKAVEVDATPSPADQQRERSRHPPHACRDSQLPSSPHQQRERSRRPPHACRDSTPTPLPPLFQKRCATYPERSRRPPPRAPIPLLPSLETPSSPPPLTRSAAMHSLQRSKRPLGYSRGRRMTSCLGPIPAAPTAISC